MQNSSYSSQDDLFILRLRQSIIKNLSNDQFSVEQLSADVGLSRSQLYRRLKLLEGQTISQYIRQVRLEEAMKMLQNNVASVTDISFLVGFNSPSYFHKCFLEHFGYTPGEVKKGTWEAQEDEENLLHPTGDKRMGKEYHSKHEFPVFEARQKGSRLHPFWRKSWISFALIFICGLVIGLFFIRDWVFYQDTEETRAIAVLPLAHLQGDPEQNFLANTVYETLIIELGKVNGLRLISKTSAQRFMQSSLLLPEIARQLRIDAVVEGSIWVADDSVSLQVQLIEVRPEERQVWAKEFRSGIKAVESLQEEMVQDLCREVLARLPAGGKK